MIPSQLLALFGTKGSGNFRNFGTQELLELRNFWRSLANCSRWEHCQNDIEWLVQPPYIPADCTQNATRAAYSLAKPDMWWALTSRYSPARSLGVTAYKSKGHTSHVIYNILSSGQENRQSSTGNFYNEKFRKFRTIDIIFGTLIINQELIGKRELLYL